MSSDYEGVDLRTARPYLIVSDADAAIGFFRQAIEATELERHTTPSGGVGHAKLRIADIIIELGEHPSVSGRDADAIPRVGLRHYVADVDETLARSRLAAPIATTDQ
jgi:PhnB protein